MDLRILLKIFGFLKIIKYTIKFKFLLISNNCPYENNLMIIYFD